MTWTVKTLDLGEVQLNRRRMIANAAGNGVVRVPVQGWAALAADLSALEVELHGDGTLRDRGRGEVVLGGPLQALQALVEAMARTTPHWRIVPGEVVTTGTITDAQPLLPGQRWQTRLSDARLAALTLETTA